MGETYIGGELEIFARARNWKRYFASLLFPLGNRVLEVGAGLGATTSILCDGTQTKWVCLEPDSELLTQVDEKIATGILPACCRTVVGVVSDLARDDSFDSILYIDVLEHIKDDATELELAARHLAPNGRLMVLSPAYPFLYSPFDKAIGHYRRYTRQSLIALTPSGCRNVTIRYLDSVGLLTSLFNRLLLRQSMPRQSQIDFWDRYLIPWSVWVDKLFRYSFGRSVVSIWERVE